MKALILVGGYGTRLRPLTFSKPKPLVEFANKPILAHQIEALVKVGVTEIILAISYQPATMKDYICKLEEKYKIKVICSQETEPLGTAGPIRLAGEILKKENKDELFFVFNSDIVCNFPLEEMIVFHKGHGKEGSIFVTEVEDPSKFGVILADQEGQINQFVEKPQSFIGNKINAGLYLFNTSIIDKIPLQPTSIEREIFPTMAKNGQLYQLTLQGFWMDVGQPKDFLSGSFLILESYKTKDPNLLAISTEKYTIIGNVLIDEDANIGEGAVLGPNVVIGRGCDVQKGVRIQNSVLMSQTVIGQHSWVSDAIIGWNSQVGKWVRIEGVTVCGEDVQIKDELFITSTFILPHRAINSSIYNKGTIIM